MRLFKLVLSLLLISFPNHSFATQLAAPPPWSYDDDYTGQEDWGASKEYEICRTGTNQSPVNIGYTKVTKLPALKFNYKPSEMLIQYSDKSLIATILDGGTVNDGGKIYKLQSVEFHSPSSHHLQGKYSPVEIHLIHSDAKGNLLIIAVFSTVDGENPAVAALLHQVKALEKTKLDGNSLLPASHGYYSYMGSLPYPPCTEGVQWRIMKTPINISTQQLTAITRYVGRNSRLLQPLYMREVLESK